jgi:hypothetical protein
MSHVPYASVVGSLMYEMVCTRPNIAHAVGFLKRYMSKPGKENWTMVKRVFRYLCGTNSYGLYKINIWIVEYLQAGMCLTYLEDQLVG